MHLGSFCWVPGDSVDARAWEDTDVKVCSVFGLGVEPYARVDAELGSHGYEDNAQRDYGVEVADA
jgi:hypothetical protein